MRKRMLSLFIAVAFVLLAGVQVGTATDISPELAYDFLPVAEVDDVPQPFVPNGIPISSTVRSDGTGIDVHVGNIGIDGLDSVTVTVSATGHALPKSLTYYVPPIIGKTFSFDFQFIKCDTTYKITIEIHDGSGDQVLNRTASLNYTEDILANAGWNKGTYGNRKISLEEHFIKHASNVGVMANNLVEYLNMATNYRAEVIRDITNNNLGNYKVTVGTGKIPSHKYKNILDYRFALLTDAGYEILSFGGK